MISTPSVSPLTTPLTIPSFSVGNVPQLCTDVIVSTFTMSQSSILTHPNMVPIVAPPVYHHLSSPTYAATLYTSETLASLQLRSTITPQSYKQFTNDLANFIISTKAPIVYLLHSSTEGVLGDVATAEPEVLKKSPIAKELYNLLIENHVDVRIINTVCYEGDNREDAKKMFGYLMKTLNLPNEPLPVSSWENSTLWGELSEDARAVMF
ncbi:Proteasome assembly chaperone 2 [Entamoeba marina]